MARRRSNHAEWGQARSVRHRRRFQQAIDDWEIDEFFRGESVAAHRPPARIPVRFGSSRLASYSAAGSYARDEEGVPVRVADREVERVAEGEIARVGLTERQPAGASSTDAPSPSLAPAGTRSAAAASAPLAGALTRPADGPTRPAGTTSANGSTWPAVPTAAAPPRATNAVSMRGIVEGFIAGLGVALLVLAAIRLIF